MGQQNRIPTSGVILIIIGAIFLLNNLNVVSIHRLFHDFWPVAIIFFGLYIIFKGSRSADREQVMSDVGMQTSSEGEIYDKRTFGQINLQAAGTPFKGGVARVTFGEIHLHIPDLELAKGTNTLRLETTFGEIRLQLGQKIPVKIVAYCLMGTLDIRGNRREGINERVLYESDDFEKADAKLVINCSTTFGEIQVW